MKNTSRVRNELSPLAELLRDCAIGAAVGLVLCIVFSLIAAIVVSVGDLPHRSVMPISMAIIGLSSFIGGLVSGKLHKRQGLLVGAIAGAGMLAVILTAGLFVPDESLGATLIIKAVASLFPALVGSVIGVNLRRKY